MSDITQVPNIERDNLIAAISQMTRNMPQMIEYERLQAKLKRERYLALIENGFDQNQALELCKCQMA